MGGARIFKESDVVSRGYLSFYDLRIRTDDIPTPY